MSTDQIAATITRTTMQVVITIAMTARQTAETQKTAVTMAAAKPAVEEAAMMRMATGAVLLWQSPGIA